MADTFLADVLDNVLEQNSSRCLDDAEDRIAVRLALAERINAEFEIRPRVT